MTTNMKAYEILAHIYAGLAMNFIDGELVWIGRREKRIEAEKIIKYFETFV